MTKNGRVLYAAVSVLTIIAACRSTVHAGPASGPPLRFESSPNGDIVLEARGATVAAVLNSMAATEGFEVVIDEHLPRPLVNLTVRTESVEDALRQVLRDRNHALVYDAGTASLERVIVLPPSAPSKAPARNRFHRPRAGARR